MGRCLHVRNHEVRALRSQATILQRLLKDNKKKIGELKEENKILKKLVDSYTNDLVARSTEQSKTTTELQKQYERLLVEVKQLSSRPFPKKNVVTSFSNKIMFVNDKLISPFMHEHTHIHIYNWAYNLVFKWINIKSFPKRINLIGLLYSYRVLYEMYMNDSLGEVS
jgi:hypothetical protein